MKSYIVKMYFGEVFVIKAHCIEEVRTIFDKKFPYNGDFIISIHEQK